MDQGRPELLQSDQPSIPPQRGPEAPDRSREAWKSELLSKPSISVRKSIAFGYDPPFEDTSTLVLTAPSGKFVDIRFPRYIEYSDSGAQKRLKDHSSYWAFSGTSETTFYDRQGSFRPGLPFTAHTKFKHDIDSKGPGIVDEGDCVLLPNGDSVEVGIWHETGRLYKEYWTQPDLLPGRSSVLKRPVIVMETTRQAKGRGIVIRIGDYIQGIHLGERDAAGERMVRVERGVLGPEVQWKAGDDLNRMWTKVRDGRGDDQLNTFLPCCMLMMNTRNYQLGSIFGSGKWEVTEFEA